MLKRIGQESSVRKDRILMFERKGPRIQCKKGKGWNSNVRKQRAGILMFERIGQEFQC